MAVVNLAETLALVTEFWSPRVVAAVNDFHVKLVKLKGEFVWHARAPGASVLRFTYQFSQKSVAAALPAGARPGRGPCRST